MKILRVILIIVFVLAAAVVIAVKNINNFQDSGAIVLPGLGADVKVVRDENGMPYIYARTLRDALFAQGFITSQDRLFQMELLRRLAKGELSEMVGEKARETDIQHRTIGFYRNAVKHTEMLDPENREYVQAYVDGVNEFIKRNDDLHFEFRLAGIRPKAWTIADCVSILYYMGWGSAANIRAEIIAQMIDEKLGPGGARGLVPISTPPGAGPIAAAGKPGTSGLLFTDDPGIRKFLAAGPGPLTVGSNNWAVGPSRSASGSPIVVNDPHLQTDMIPGPWYPSGIITPEVRAVGVIVPGFPGVIIGKTGNVAVGLTNSYHDAQDLYIETVDPDDDTRYVEGGRKIPFTVIRETLVIKDKKASGGYRKEDLAIRLTRRGPVISGAFPSLKSKNMVTFRWSPFETMTPTLGVAELLKVKNAEGMRKAVSKITIIMLNFVFADTSGNIGWMTSGKIPIRRNGNGSEPLAVTDGADNWKGFIPADGMPQAMNPPEGWIATANNRTVPENYRYFISTFFSPHYRYSRIRELLTEKNDKTAAGDHWKYMRDHKNLMAGKVAPVMAKILARHDDTKKLAEILTKWDFFDDKDRAAPLVFQAVYRRFALRTFRDELGEDLAMAMLGEWYLWQERLEKMVLAGSSPWFDDVTTGTKESMDDLFHHAAADVTAELGESLGNDPSGWRWGDVHRITFVSPLMKKGILKGLFGGGSHAMSGSGETVYRGIYKFKEPFGIYTSASLRMVADLGDPDKVVAVLPGGAGGRVFEPSTTNQIDAYINGDISYWWFSDTEIGKHAESVLLLKRN